MNDEEAFLAAIREAPGEPLPPWSGLAVVTADRPSHGLSGPVGHGGIGPNEQRVEHVES